MKKNRLEMIGVSSINNKNNLFTFPFGTILDIWEETCVYIFV